MQVVVTLLEILGLIALLLGLGLVWLPLAFIVGGLALLVIGYGLTTSTTEEKGDS